MRIICESDYARSGHEPENRALDSSSDRSQPFVKHLGTKLLAKGIPRMHFSTTSRATKQVGNCAKTVSQYTKFTVEIKQFYD
jgi:hypothetical protein